MLTSLKSLALLGLVTLVSHAAFAQEPPAGSRAAAPGRVLWGSPEAQITLPIQDEPSTASVTIPAVPISGKPVVLRFQARFQWPVVGGIARSLGMTLNKQALGPGNAPVINRELIETSMENHQAPPSQGNGWWMPNKGWSLVLHYTPDEQTLEPRVLTDQDEGQWYLLLVTDLLAAGSENTLELVNHAVTSTWAQTTLRDPTGIIIEHLSLVELDDLP